MVRAAASRGAGVRPRRRGRAQVPGAVTGVSGTAGVRWIRYVLALVDDGCGAPLAEPVLTRGGSTHQVPHRPTLGDKAVRDQLSMASPWHGLAAHDRHPV